MTPLRLLLSPIGTALTLVILSHGGAGAVTLFDPSSTASPVHEFPNGTPGGPLHVDAAGTLYVGLGSDGIHKITLAGTESPWSSLNSPEFAISSSGDGYAVGPDRHTISRLSSGGVASMLIEADTLEWMYVAIDPDGSLWATSQQFGARDALNHIDTVTGERTVVFLGGPLPPGQGIPITLGPITFGNDGELYLAGTVFEAIVHVDLFRLDGTALTSLATLPHGGRLERGPGSLLYATANFQNPVGYINGEVWSVDIATGTSELVARACCGLDMVFWGTAYSAQTEKLYVGESGWRSGSTFNNAELWAISSSVPVRTESWGAVKARYRGTR